MKSGLLERLPYSLSRWTDVAADESKWAWLQEAFRTQHMLAFDPRTVVPYEWSLKPEDTLGLILWTKDPTHLLYDAPWLRDYRVKLHVTVTGWEEAEPKAPTLRQGADLLARSASVFGVENVIWRFSPVPVVPDVVRRFEVILSAAADHGVRDVYLSFLQENDLMPETRTEDERRGLLVDLAEAGVKRGLRVYLCQDDSLLLNYPHAHPNLALGVCAPPFAPSDEVEGCGCAIVVDPFTVNEACSVGCSYCYAGDKALSPKRRNTVGGRKSLPIVR